MSRRALHLSACIGVVVALIGIFYAEEDWRGRRDWNRYRKTKEAQGEPLDFQSYIPRPVPEDQNFAETEIAQSLLQPDWNAGRSLLPDDLYAHASGNVYPRKISRLNTSRHFTDLVAWQMASVALQSGPLTSKQIFETDKMDLAAREMAAPAVLEGMKPDQKAFAALRLASQKPHSRFNVRYDLEDLAQIPIGHLVGIKGLCLRLDVQVCAELAAGQTDSALADSKLLFYLADSIKTEPFVISYLVRVACFQLAVQPVWEGLAERRWTDAQLQQLQSSLQNYDFLRDLNQSLKSERTFGIQEINQFKKQGLGTLDELAGVNDALRLDDIGSKTVHKAMLDFVGRVMPEGWWDEERWNYCLIFDAQMKGATDLAEKKVFPGQLGSNYSELTRHLTAYSPPASLNSILHHQAIVATEDVPQFLNRLPQKAAAAQTAANQALIACALERYRLANGQFPETLEALPPQFIFRLPNDVITGQPYKYHPTKDGQFILYSVGWNEKDDGGIPGKQGLFDAQEGDWVWEYPVK
ncbi:MAG TPA: hypothetical protein VFC44_12050 [Candidatus Saccharimonadales bacterium]|nr:hypothetical protein [Candidatus Saccharimonadales bacterium]